MASVLTSKLDKYDLSGEIVSNVIGKFSLATTLVILPISLIAILFVKAEKIEN